MSLQTMPAIPDMTGFTPANIPLRENVNAVAAVHPLRFQTVYRNVLVSKPGEPEKWEQKGEEWVEVAKKGVTIPTTTRYQIAKLKKGAEKAAAANDPDNEAGALWRAIQPFYDAWKAGNTDELIQGTPLNAWGGVTRDEVEALRPFRIHSVEDFATMNDAVMQRIPFPNIAAKRDRAKKWLSSKETADEVRGQLSEMLEANKKLMAELEAMRAKDAAEKQIAAFNKPKADDVATEAVEEKPARGRKVKEKAA